MGRPKKIKVEKPIEPSIEVTEIKDIKSEISAAKQEYLNLMEVYAKLNPIKFEQKKEAMLNKLASIE